VSGGVMADRTVVMSSRGRGAFASAGLSHGSRKTKQPCQTDYFDQITFSKNLSNNSHQHALEKTKFPLIAIYWTMVHCNHNRKIMQDQ
jgi:hypothetical protein